MSIAPKVLVVDDDPDSRALLELALSTEGYDVLTASNGAEALVIARECPLLVILLDLSMPVMDGFGFRAAQLSDPTIAAVPVICVSGRHDVKQVAVDLKFLACVGKPFALEEIVSRVETIAGASCPWPPGTPPAGLAFA
jgi:DNA-binding response OmpR family regulator